ncbi:helix-turn-helix transcriptional regulator [Flexivirga alba]|uniref:Helix-turn-helix transcriptional regulator n=1 Tax=Flexivirga alba TaxID=702742 RepID=A0ABW2AJ41_9MICO
MTHNETDLVRSSTESGATGITDVQADPATTILTIDQASEYLSISKATLYTWRTRRAGFGPPALKLGNCLRYRRSDLDDWVGDHVEIVDTASPRSDDGISLSRHSRPR